MLDRMESQTATTEVNGKRHELKVVAEKAGVSWKHSFDGSGTREFRASTCAGAKYFELRTSETHFPDSRDKRITQKETYIDLTRESAVALRDLLNVMLGEAAL